MFVPKLIIHWPRFGPYHLARLNATHMRFQKQGFQILGLETAGQDSTYHWRKTAEAVPFKRVTLAENEIVENLGRRQLWSKLSNLLQQIQPDAVAISGYSAPDAQMLLLWCRVHQVPAILMSASKFDDAPRSLFRESVKSFLVRQYAAAICGGKPQRTYLEKLGMKPDRIFVGYDAVDNEYFYEKALEARKNSNNYHHLPGLADSDPFFLASSRFVARKNLIGLLKAYQVYMEQIRQREVQPWRLVILGDGEERENLEEFISGYQIDGVTLAGFRQIEELPIYYGLANAFIHPALQEQWGLVVNEAMACGLPVFVSEKCGCAYDLIHPGENGYTFDPGSISQISDLMLQATIGELDLEAMGQASKEIISNWGIPQFAEGMWCAFKDVVSKK